jgi:transcriptional regulator with XRE-family HTH domain
MRGYAGFDQPELAEQLGVSTTTLSRLENGRAGVTDTLLVTAARVCGVPLVFAEVGFSPLERPISNVEARIFELEQRLTRERQELLAEVATLAGEAVDRAIASGQLPTGAEDDATETG